MENRRIKDPIYGYIEIPKKLFEQVIDTPEFQRLRDVVQTSYPSLYPSTLHNRFVHSLGVYHLGAIAFDNLLSNSKIETIQGYKDTFLLACLLHDVGHAPFSHTGEDFYLKEGKRDSLHEELVQLTEDTSLEIEIKNQGYKAAAHEIMSSIVGLKVFRASINEKQYGFFARCILGYKYVENLDEEEKIANCLIEMLNSRILDVDKIDYLIRDAYMSGFSSSSIDYQRLLSQISIEKEDGEYKLAFSKNALSVIDNVVFAHDFERKWVQSHPTVQYESFVIKRILEELVLVYFSDLGFLPEKMLTQEGFLEGDKCIRLASDSDIIHLMKNLSDNEAVNEYYDRRKRKHPLWKTEEEFQAIFFDQEEYLETLISLLKQISAGQNTGYICINQTVLDNIRQEIEEVGKEVFFQNDEKCALLSIKNRIITFMEIFKHFSEEENIAFDYIVIFANQFNSSFRKPEFGDIKIKLSSIDGLCRYGDISSIVERKNNEKREFFYIFSGNKHEGDVLSFSSLITKLLTFAGTIRSESNAKSVGRRIRQ